MKSMRIRRSSIAAAVVALMVLAGCGEAERVEKPRASERSTRPSTSLPSTDRATAASAAAQSAQSTDGSGSKSGETDTMLSAKVRSALAAEPDVGHQEIDVAARRGRITLSGAVQSQELRQRALQAARSVEGVEGVVDRLAVRRG
jgi:hyperosmotically inducible protein